MIIEQLGRGAAVVGLSSSILGRLFAEMDMQGTLPRHVADLVQRLALGPRVPNERRCPCVPDHDQ